MVGPDIAENEGPDPDEDVDEHLNGSGRRQNPARLILDAFGRRLGQNKRFVMPPPATAAPSVLTASPIQAPATSGSCHRNVCARTAGSELRPPRKPQPVTRPGSARRAGADGAASRNRRSDAADRDARGERRRPFAAEAEAICARQIDDRPIDQIGLDDRGNAAQHQRGRQIELACGGDRDEVAPRMTIAILI